MSLVCLFNIALKLKTNKIKHCALVYYQQYLNQLFKLSIVIGY